LHSIRRQCWQIQGERQADSEIPQAPMAVAAADRAPGTGKSKRASPGEVASFEVCLALGYLAFN